VLSRCLQFQLKNLSPERIAQYLAGVLADESVPCEPQALELIATAARGSMRDALSITDQAIAFGQGSVRAADVSDMLGLVGRDAVAGLVEALAAGDAARLLAMSAELAERSVDFDDVLAELIEAFHRMAVAQALAGPGGNEGAFPPEVVQLYYQIALMGYRDLGIAPDPRCGFEMTLLRMLAFAPDGGDAAGTGSSTGGAQAGRSRSPAPPAPSGPASAGAPRGSMSLVGMPGSGLSAVGGASVSVSGARPLLGAVSAARMESPAPPLVEVPRVPEASPVAQPVSRAAVVEADASAQVARTQDRAIAELGVRDAEEADVAAAGDAQAAPSVRAEPERTAAAPPTAASDAWCETVRALGLAGVARMIAEHSELVERGDRVYRLRLDAAHDTLLADGPVASLERALAARDGAPVRVLVEVGAVFSETPAARFARERIERQRAAEQVLATDATVQQLLSDFGARIEGVSPVE
jgi:DNA polymerase-3 subunit gamma/tau